MSWLVLRRSTLKYAFCAACFETPTTRPIALNERWRSRNATICSSRRAISCLACAVFVSPPAPRLDSFVNCSNVNWSDDLQLTVTYARATASRAAGSCGNAARVPCVYYIHGGGMWLYAVGKRRSPPCAAGRERLCSGLLPMDAGDDEPHRSRGVRGHEAGNHPNQRGAW